jgi:hypothetical protein
MITNSQKLSALILAVEQRTNDTPDLYGHLSIEQLNDGVKWYTKRTERYPNRNYLTE